MHRESTDIVDLLRNGLRPLETHAAAQGIELKVIALGDVPKASVDREKIAWCVATLVGNALRYVSRTAEVGDAGGSILVHVEYDGERPEQIAVAVQDDGPGIPDEQLPYLFERRTGAMHADGLALLLIREIVEAHDGEIQVETRRGADEHGTSITLRIRR